MKINTNKVSVRGTQKPVFLLLLSCDNYFAINDHRGRLTGRYSYGRSGTLRASFLPGEALENIKGINDGKFRLTPHTCPRGVKECANISLHIGHCRALGQGVRRAAAFCSLVFVCSDYVGEKNKMDIFQEDLTDLLQGPTH